MRGDDLGAFDQPGPEHGVSEVGLRLGQIADRVRLGHGAAPQARDLREDEPHPMAGLAAVPELGDRVLVCATTLLRSDETLEIHEPSRR